MTLLEQHGESREKAELLYERATALQDRELAALYGRVIMLLDEANRLVLVHEP